MHEEKYSGLRRTPNTYQIRWTLYNVALDNNRELDDIDDTATTPQEVPDFFIYELKKAGMSVEDMEKKLRLSKQEIEERLSQYIEKYAAFRPVKEKLDEKYNKAGSAYRHRRNNIG